MIFKSLLAAEGRVCKLCYKLGFCIVYHIVVDEGMSPKYVTKMNAIVSQCQLENHQHTISVAS